MPTLAQPGNVLGDEFPFIGNRPSFCLPFSPIAFLGGTGSLGCASFSHSLQQRLTKDHSTPLSKGSAHTLTNVVPACQSCNSKKHTGPPLKPVQPLLLLA